MLPGTMLLSQVLLFARRVGGKRKIFSTLPGLSAHGPMLSRSSLAAVSMTRTSCLHCLLPFHCCSWWQSSWSRQGWRSVHCSALGFLPLLASYHSGSFCISVLQATMWVTPKQNWLIHLSLLHFSDKGLF